MTIMKKRVSSHLLPGHVFIDGPQNSVFRQLNSVINSVIAGTILQKYCSVNINVSVFFSFYQDLCQY